MADGAAPAPGGVGNGRWEYRTRRVSQRRSRFEQFAVRPRTHKDEGGLFQPMDQEEIPARVACLVQSSLDRNYRPIKCIEN